MARIIVNITPYEGDYELDFNRVFNTHEWRWIREISGYQPLTFDDGMAAGDPSLFLALAVICMRRAGKVERDRVLNAADEMAEAPVDGVAITLVADTVKGADDEIPLDLTKTPAEPSPPRLPSNNDTRLPNESPSGSTLTKSSAPSEATPSVTSLLRSGTS